MDGTVAPAARTPWHLWVVGGVSLLWNAMGALDFFMTQTRNEAYMKALTPEQLEYFYGLPFWVVACWGIATWGSVAGSLLLLFRQRLAVPVLLGSFVCMVVTTLRNLVFSNGWEVMGGGAGALIFSAVIFAISLLLVIYARAMRRRGALR